jgi:predicted outer membrane repeat protein
VIISHSTDAIFFAGYLLGLRALLLPKEAAWSPGQAWLLDIYDWDLVLVKKDAALSFGLRLCFGLFPCSMWIKGKPAGVIQRQEKGYISCLFSDGCDTIRLEGIRFICNSTRHQNSSFKIQGATLSIFKSNFVGCFSSDDGGVIQSFDRSTVNVRMSSFSDSHSDRFGGAISAYGGSVHIFDSIFSNIFAARGGGAVWSSAYQSCYGVLQYHDTVLQVADTTFTNCTTNGDGGAILVSSAADASESSSSSAVVIKSSTHTYCRSSGNGGAIYMSGKSVTADISLVKCFSNSAYSGGAIAAGYGVSLSLQGSYIHNNTATDSGGAISASYGVSLILIESEVHYNTALGSGGAIAGNNSEVALINCRLNNNKALGFGGGALFLKETSFSAHITSCSRNHAPFGGGGVLLLQGPKIPSPEVIIQMCNQSNYAQYGPCMASECKSVSLAYNYSENLSSWAGLPIKLAVVKLDAYQQIILTDNSFVQVLSSTTDQDAVEGLKSQFSFVGSSVSQCVRGYTLFEVAIKPMFVELNADQDRARIQTQPYIYVQSPDSQTGAVMQSNTLSIDLEEGGNVCPQGYVLDLDLQSELSLPTAGTCKICKQGTYSLIPLAGPTKSIPGCFPCPVGAECLKDGKIRTKMGNWTQVHGMLNLIHCPGGHTLRSTALTGSADLQECQPCLATQYILRPDIDACQNCPPGLNCGGTDVVTPVVEGSTWIYNGSIYQLLSCPAGYSVLSSGVSGSFDAIVQRCSPCPKGAECVTAPCTACSLCKPGSYKAAVSIDACLPCPANTYNPLSGGQALSSCQQCPEFSSTQGQVSQGSQTACMCHRGYYMDTINTSRTQGNCLTCPAGATCSGGVALFFGKVMTQTIQISISTSEYCCVQSIQRSIISSLTQSLGIASSSLFILSPCADMQCSITNGLSSTQPAEHAVTNGYFVDPNLKSMETKSLSPLVRAARAQSSPNKGIQLVFDADISQSLNFPDSRTLSETFSALTNFSLSVISSESLASLDLAGHVYGPIDSQGQYHLVGCRQGYILVNDSITSQSCTPCIFGTYSLNPTDGCSSDWICRQRSVCNQCPAGAICLGASEFEPIVNGSVWVPILDPATMITVQHLTSCPPGEE